MRQMRWIGVVGDADALGPGVFGVGLGATNEIGNEMFSQELEKWEKKAVQTLLSWLKERYELVINII